MRPGHSRRRQTQYPKSGRTGRYGDQQDEGQGAEDADTVTNKKVKRRQEEEADTASDKKGNKEEDKMGGQGEEADTTRMETRGRG